MIKTIDQNPNMIKTRIELQLCCFGELCNYCHQFQHEFCHSVSAIQSYIHWLALCIDLAVQSLPLIIAGIHQ